MRGIAVIDQPQSDKVVIWHVSVGDGLESTMAGAWVLSADDDRIDGLLAGRLTVTTPSATTRFGVGPDVAALATAIDAAIATLDADFAAHVATLPSSRRSLVRPRWPQVPGASTPEAAGDSLATEALTLARWVSTLLVAWDRVEKERLARPFLAVRGGDRPRDLPPGWRTSESMQEAS